VFNTKSIFSWNIPDVLGGDPIKFAQLLVDGGFEGVYLKGGEGNIVFRMWPSSPWPTWGKNIRQELVDALRKVGLKVYIWHFLYGVDPAGELSIADYQCTQFHPDGYIWDAESRFDEQPNADANARFITNGLIKAHPDIPQALCWWALPKNPLNVNIQWHPIHVAKAFMERVNCVMPMMYWDGSTSQAALSYLAKSLGIWRGFCNLPIVPVGRAYTGDAGFGNPEAIKAFAQKVMEISVEKNLIGISWWLLDKASENSIWWEALKTTPKWSGPPQLSDKEKIERLVNAHKDLFPEMFE